MTIIEWMNQLLVHKKPWDSFTESDQKSFSPFIINRWLSMDKEFIEIVNYFQKYAIGTLEPKEVYKWYLYFLPMGKRYNKYIKSKNKKKYDTVLVDVVCKHFECSKQQVGEYLELIRKEEFRDILAMYGTDKNQIKMMVK